MLLTLHLEKHQWKSGLFSQILCVKKLNGMSQHCRVGCPHWVTVVNDWNIQMLKRVLKIMKWRNLTLSLSSSHELKYACWERCILLFRCESLAEVGGQEAADKQAINRPVQFSSLIFLSFSSCRSTPLLCFFSPLMNHRCRQPSAEWKTSNRPFCSAACYIFFLCFSHIKMWWGTCFFFYSVTHTLHDTKAPTRL